MKINIIIHIKNSKPLPDDIIDIIEYVNTSNSRKFVNIITIDDYQPDNIFHNTLISKCDFIITDDSTQFTYTSSNKPVRIILYVPNRVYDWFIEKVENISSV